MLSFHWETILLLWASGLLGGVAPLLVKWDTTYLHHLLALGTGMLLATVFYHMLPEATTNSFSITILLIGLLAIFLVEYVIFPRVSFGGEGSSRDRHLLVGNTAYLGLSFHAFAAGIGLAITLSDPSLRAIIVSVMIIHKISEALSLSAILLLAEFSVALRWGLIILFSFITPLGILLGGLGATVLSGKWFEGATGFAAGTFLYITLCDLLPEVFHPPTKRLLNFILLLIGIIAGGFYLIWSGNPVGH
ncbi:MAG: ZIP family metal transporter [bacterium]